ncbi:MAG: hypothetical protein NTW59_05220 [Candidatus Diapherotrites archaeon]|nr:hypothetical protein [Candidatus Diapherotrites archaeon]
MSELTIVELACLRLLKRKVPKASPQQMSAMLCLMREKQSYLSLEEISGSTRIHNSELQKIMRSLAKEQLVEKEGCLYKKPELQKIAELIACE